MVIDRHDGAACPAHVSCQRVEGWFRWQRAWQPIFGVPPKPTGMFAAIGSNRALHDVGKQAIEPVLDLAPIPPL